MSIEQVEQGDNMLTLLNLQLELLICQQKIVVQCQNDRSQHKNKESAMKQLRAKLYAHELNKKNEIKNQVESEKSDISSTRLDLMFWMTQELKI